MRRVILCLLALAFIVASSGCIDALWVDNDESTIQFRNVAPDAGLRINASEHDSIGNGRQGVYVTDYNNDGWPDILTIGGVSSPVLFENKGSHFERSGAIPVTAKPLRATFKSALFVDYDNDGWEDLLLLARQNYPKLLENRNGSFVVRQAGIENVQLTLPVAATALDYNGDGCLDLFVAQSGRWGDRTPVGYQTPNETISQDNGAPNYLFRGNCSSFERVENAGIVGDHWSLAVSSADFTGNGLPDIHVANDYYPDVLYVNRGDGTFERRVLGEATDRNGMSSEVADVNGDGRLDIFVTNIYLEPANMSDPFRTFALNRFGDRLRGNNLLINQGNGTFVDRAAAYGVKRGGWGWAAVIEDLDNDGDRDLVHVTSAHALSQAHGGNASTTQLWERIDARYVKRNATRRGFETISGRGIASLDYDRDGDIDLVVSNYDGPFKLYENRGETGNWLRIDVHSGPSPNVHARVYLTINGTTRSRVVHSDSDFLSQDSRVVHFGIGEHDIVDRVRVVWPDGTSTTFEDIRVNQRLLVRSSDSETRSDS